MEEKKLVEGVILFFVTDGHLIVWEVHMLRCVRKGRSRTQRIRRPPPSGGGAAYAVMHVA